MIPDVEAIVTKYLKAATGTRVVGSTPSNTESPWVRLTQLDADAVGGHRSDHLISWLGQFDCYAGGGGQGEAGLLTREVREALRLAPEDSELGAVVTGVEFLSCPRILDTDFKPARERYSLTAEIFIHA